MKKISTIILLSIVLLTVHCSMAQTRRYVTVTGAGTKDGSSWVNASDNLQNMINASAANNQVWVAAGTYYPTRDGAGNVSTTRDRTFLLKNSVSMYGSFAGNETDISQRDFTANETILSGDFNKDDLANYVNYTENAFHVIAAVSFTGIFDGFTSTGGNANNTTNGSVGGYGIPRSWGGVMLAVYGTPTINRCKFLNNTGIFSGIYAYNTVGMVVSNSNISANYSSNSGSGISTAASSNVLINNCRFTSNTSLVAGCISNSTGCIVTINTSSFISNIGLGGAAVANLGTATINNSFFYNNTAFRASDNLGTGGAFQNYTNPATVGTLNNCIIANNAANGSADDGGGGIMVYGGTVNVNNCSLYGNTTTSSYNTTGNGISIQAGCTVNLRNTIIAGAAAKHIRNAGAINYTNSLVKGETLTTPNVNGDAMYVNASLPLGADGIFGTADDGLNLSWASPAKRTGTLTGAPANDVAGRPRSATPDMGAYETPAVTGDWTADAGTNDWFTPGNWTGNAVPDQTSNAVIPAFTSLYPAAASTATCKDLIINKDATLALNTSNINVYGNLNVQGVISATTGVVTLTGATQQNIKGNFSLPTLNLNNAAGATLLTDNEVDRLSITNLLTVNAGVLTTAGKLVLKSGAASTAAVGAGTGNNYINGNVTVERYLNTNTIKRRWHLLTLPGTAASVAASWREGGINDNGYGTIITNPAGGTGYDASPVGVGSSSIREFNNTATLLSTPEDLTATTPAGKAYFLFIRGDRTVLPEANGTTAGDATLRLKGTSLNQGTITLTNAMDITGYAAIGNPFASPISFSGITRPGTGGFYLWDPALNTNGGYVLYDANGDIVAGNNTTYGNSGVAIQSGQGFLAISTGIAGDVVISESSKTTTVNNVLRTANTAKKLDIRINKIENGTPVFNDAAAVIFDNAASRNYSIAEDVTKPGNFGLNFSLYRNNQWLTLEKMPEPVTTDTVFLQLWKHTTGNYQIELHPYNIGNMGQAFIVDKYTGSSTPVNMNGVSMYSFSVDESITQSMALGRFVIVFKAAAALPVSAINVKAYQKNTGVNIDWSVPTEAAIKAYDVEKSSDGISFISLGSVSAKNINNSSYTVFDATPVNGINYYRIKTIALNSTVKYSSAVRVILNKDDKQMLSIYPNPVKDNVVNVSLNNLQKGSYILAVYTNDGKQIASSNISINNSGTVNITIALPLHTAKGVYYVKLLQANTYSQIAVQQLIVE